VLERVRGCEFEEKNQKSFKESNIGREKERVKGATRKSKTGCGFGATSVFPEKTSGLASGKEERIRTDLQKF